MLGKYFSFYNEKYELIKYKVSFYKRCKSIYNKYWDIVWEIIIMFVMIIKLYLFNEHFFFFCKIHDESNNAKFEKKLTVYSL